MQKLAIKPTKFFSVLTGTERSQVAEMVLGPDSATGGPKNKHAGSDQWLYVVSGSGQAIVNDKKVKLAAGDLLLIEAGENHEIINSGSTPLKTFNIYTPPEY